MECLFQQAGGLKKSCHSLREAGLCRKPVRSVVIFTARSPSSPAAAEGLGEAIAREFAARGAQAPATGRNAGRGEAVAESLRTAGCDARFHKVDLADLDAVRLVVPAAEKVFGHIDILVNAAGDTDRGSIFDTSPELYERIMASEPEELRSS